MKKQHSSGNESDLIESVSTGDHATFFRLVNEGADIYALDAEGHSLRWHAELKHDQTILDSLALLESANGRKMEEGVTVEEEKEAAPVTSTVGSEEVVSLQRKVKNLDDGITGIAGLLFFSLIILFFATVVWDQNDNFVENAYNGSEKLVKLNLFLGADIDKKKVVGHNTALMMASGTGHIDIVKLLLEKGANVNIKNDEGNSALTLALRSRHRNSEKIAKLLLEYGANPNSMDKTASTALILAVERGYVDVVVMLIESGADINAKDNWGSTVLDHAPSALYSNLDLNEDEKCIFDKNKAKIKELLKSAGAKSGRYN